MTINVGPLNIHAGPYLSYLVSANVKNLRTSDLITIITIGLNNVDFHKVDYGLLAGVGFDVQNVTIDKRYNHGLREVSKDGMDRNFT